MDDAGAAQEGNAGGEAADRERLRERLYDVDPFAFEEFVAELWAAEGWETTVTQGSADMGVDVVAERSGTVDQRLVVQVKRYGPDNPVGRPAVQQYHSMKAQDAAADAAVVVTSSRFTRDAREWAARQNVKLVDGADLVDLVRSHDMADRLATYADRGRVKEDEGPLLDESDDGPARTSGGSGAAWLVALALAGQVAGAWLVVDPSVAPEVGRTAALGVFAMAWFLAPFGAAADVLARSSGDRTLLGLALWPGLLLVGPVVVPALYLLARLRGG
jgi:hypothetical protein